MADEVTSQLYSGEYLLLRKLLHSWGLDCLVQHFIDEGITIDVLEMLKLHQLPALLRNHKFGIQIRFEHHLEHWRRQINKPLAGYAPGPSCCQQQRSTPEDSTAQPPPSPLVKSVFTQCPQREQPAYKLEPPPRFSSPPTHLAQSRPSTPRPSPGHIYGSSTTQDTRHPPKLTPAPPTSSSAATTVNSQAIGPIIRSLSPPPSSPTASPLAALSAACDIKHSVFGGNDDYRTNQISVIYILQASLPKGQQLLDYYREHQTLTNAHRLLLINLIATFFDENDFHLSLKTSYNMEREILDMFPTERLDYYRTEKRGKIYVKFCNMKRYKTTREKPALKRRRDEPSGFFTVEPVVGNPGSGDVMANMVDDEFSMNFDSWEQAPPMEVYIKTENLNDDGY